MADAVHLVGASDKPLGIRYSFDFFGRALDLAGAAPELREKITSPSGLESIMRDGLADPAKLSAEVLAAVQKPFRTAEARRALADAGIGLSRKGFAQIARKLPTLRHSRARGIRRPGSGPSRCRADDGPGARRRYRKAARPS